MPAKVKMEGKKFGRLQVLQEEGRDKYGQILWTCKCDCGNTIIVRGADLRTHKTVSCGCKRLETAIEVIQKQTVNHSNPASIRSKKLSKANTSGIRGVCPDKNGYWIAYIGHKGKRIYLGCFRNKEEAIWARKKAEELYFGKVLQESGFC